MKNLPIINKLQGLNIMPSLQINDIELYYEIHGEGEPLMMIAGLGSDSQSWQPIVNDLSQHFMLIIPDNRGTGRTTPQDTEISIQKITDDSMALVKHLGLSSFNLLGHSMGGFVALDLAIRYPYAVEKLILAATAASNPKKNNILFSKWATTLEYGMDTRIWFRNIFNWLFTEDFLQNEVALDAALDYAVDYPYPQSSIAFRKQIEAIAEFNCYEQLSNIKTKTLIIGGEKDILFPADTIASLAESMPESTFSLIENAAHSIHMEQPQLFLDVVLDFLLPTRDR